MHIINKNEEKGGRKMNNVGVILAGLVFSYFVYFGFCQKGFFMGYVLNFIYCFVMYYLQKSPITAIAVAGMFLSAAIISILEYIAYRKTQSFLGYVAYFLVIIIAILLTIFLCKTLFTFLADPSILFRK